MMSYKPIEYMPQTSRYLLTQPTPEPEQDKSGLWIDISLKLCGVMAAVTSVAMLYLVFMIGMGRW